MSEMVPVQSLEAVRAHLKLSHMLNATWRAAAPSAVATAGVGDYQELLRTRVVDLGATGGGDADGAGKAPPAQIAELALENEVLKRAYSNLRVRHRRPNSGAHALTLLC